MKINSIQVKTDKPNTLEKKTIVSKNNLETNTSYANYSALNAKANFLPLSFKGNAPDIKSAFLITTDEADVPLLETKVNGSYVIDFDSQTEVIYGKKAISFLNREDEFVYDTQVIIPKKCEGTLEIKGKKIPLTENSAVMINGGTDAKVTIKKGYPMVILSKKDYDWYERYTKNAVNEGIRNKFLELMYHNSHSYNGEISPNILLPEKFQSDKYLQSLGINKYQAANNLVNELNSKLEMMSEEDKTSFTQRKQIIDKLQETGLTETIDNGYIKFKVLYDSNYQEKVMREKGFTEEEIAIVMPIYNQIKTIHADSRFARTGKANDIPQELLAKLKEKGILHNNKKRTETIFWKESFGNEDTLRKKLRENGFNDEEQNTVVRIWHEQNNTGFDVSGLKFIDKNSAVYNLNDKLNNWTWEKTNWVTNSTALVSENGTTPFVGTSLVQTDEPRVFSMADLRKDEKLHKHPCLDDKRQTELYLITSGAAALTVVRNGKPETKIIKEGDLAVIDPGVEHCVNSVIGEYEHIVVQVPSAFQYGFDFKCITKEPEGFDKEAFTREAKFALEESRALGLI